MEKMPSKQSGPGGLGSIILGQIDEKEDFERQHTYMPNEKLKVSHIITMGAKTVAILAVPNGCIKKSSTKIPHDVPTIIE